MPDTVRVFLFLVLAVAWLTTLLDLIEDIRTSSRLGVAVFTAALGATQIIALIMACRWLANA